MQDAHIAGLQAKVSDMAARLGVTGQMADAAVARAGELAEARTQMAAKTREVGDVRWLQIDSDAAKKPAAQLQGYLLRAIASAWHGCMEGHLYHCRCRGASGMFHQHSSKLRSCEVAEQLILGVQVGQLRGELDDERARADYLAQVAALHQLPSPCGMPAPAPSGNISRPRKTRVHTETLFVRNQLFEEARMNVLCVAGAGRGAAGG